MATRRDKPKTKQNFLKRRSFEDGLALVDAAHIATHRLYCETLRFWRGCANKRCKRHRRCEGEPTGCLMRNLPDVLQVMAGGPRRIAPAAHVERLVRRTELATVLSWGFGQRPKDKAVAAAAAQVRPRSFSAAT